MAEAKGQSEPDLVEPLASQKGTCDQSGIGVVPAREINTPNGRTVTAEGSRGRSCQLENYRFRHTRTLLAGVNFKTLSL